MNEDARIDALRELTKIEDALAWAERHFEKVSEANAALHCNDRVMYSPLAGKISAALSSVELVRARVSE